ncbi:MAG: outer membrane protein assembly factor BamD [Acidobacteriota bacterium]|jgi:outer membrane protein assembly factor BamD|nr:outer membrane protein assembly factor BamD [Acidobacteriota bacterium]NLT33946.1 outer membrane protein assembly factor BamD [Acidobacteriota bacterium]
MRWIVRCVAMGMLLAGLVGCSQKSARLQKGVVPPDQTLFDTGSDYLKKGQYIKSRLAFQTLLNTYPDSEVAAEAYFAMGDSFYEEGGTENLLQAEDQYKNFIVFYPQHPRAVDAQLKIISANYKLINTPDRDQQYTRRTLDEITQFERRFGDSDYLPIVRQWRSTVEDVLARGDYGVGKFYADRGNVLGALGRYQEIVDKYPDYAERDVVLYKLGQIYERSRSEQDHEKAKEYYAEIAREFPFSRHYLEARERLGALGAEIPEVDTEMAARHRANVKESKGFSPLKPLIDFGKALGFVPPPDQYEVAQKTLEAEKARNAELAAAEAKAAAGDDILIETEIRKSASGADAGQAAGDAGAAEQEKGSSRYKRKQD